jgi:hypothetical protein
MAAARYAWYGRVSTEDEQDPTLSFSRQLNNSERRVAESGGLIVAHFYNVESGTRRYDPASPSPAGQRRRIWRRTQRCSGLSRAPGEIRTHTVGVLSALPAAGWATGAPPSRALLTFSPQRWRCGWTIRERTSVRGAYCRFDLSRPHTPARRRQGR